MLPTFRAKTAQAAEMADRRRLSKDVSVMNAGISGLYLDCFRAHANPKGLADLMLWGAPGISPRTRKRWCSVVSDRGVVRAMLEDHFNLNPVEFLAGGCV